MNSMNNISIEKKISDNERPKSCLARGVQISEFVDPRINPRPASYDISDTIMQENLSPQKLHALTGCDDLNDVKQLELHNVNTSEKSLGNFGIYVPNLEELRMKHSILSSIRDLGSSLTKLKVLWLPRCSVIDLDGLSLMDNLVELYLAYNDITDLSHFGMLENLEILDLDGNNIDSISQVSFLLFCTKLTKLSLDGNPICIRPNPDDLNINKEYDYRLEIKAMLGKQLKFLNNEPVERLSCSGPISHSGVKNCVTEFDEDWELLDELMQDGSLVEPESTETINAGIATPSYRPGSALKPSSAFLRPASRSSLLMERYPSSGFNTARPGSTTSVPRTSSSNSSGIYSASDSDAGNILTNGPIVCGNLSRALIKRKNMVEESKEANNVLQSEDSGIGLLNIEENLTDEINNFKAEHKRIMARIEADKTPQVLKIDHSLHDLDEEEDDFSDVEHHQLNQDVLEEKEFYNNIKELASSPLPLALQRNLDPHVAATPRDIAKIRSLRNKDSYQPQPIRRQNTLPANDEFYKPSPPVIRRSSNLTNNSIKANYSLKSLSINGMSLNDGKIKNFELPNIKK